MRKQSIFIIAFSLIALSLYADGAKLHNKMGIGYSASASTTPTEFVFEQTMGTELILTGDFASDTNWTKTTDWSIAGGVASYTNYNVLIGGTNVTGVISQTSIDLTTNVAYRLIYTVSGITNGSAQTFTPYLGDNPLTARTSDGTYTEELKLFGDMTLAFYVTSTNAVTNNLDNVSLYQKPDLAYVDYLDLASATSGAGTVYFNFNCTGDQFTNLYSTSRCMRLESDKPLSLPAPSPLYNIWYRTATGTESFTLNGL